jgi:hypothetical protein
MDDNFKISQCMPPSRARDLLAIMLILHAQAEDESYDLLTLTQGEVDCALLTKDFCVWELLEDTDAMRKEGRLDGASFISRIKSDFNENYSAVAKNIERLVSLVDPITWELLNVADYRWDLVPGGAATLSTNVF